MWSWHTPLVTCVTLPMIQTVRIVSAHQHLVPGTPPGYFLHRTDTLQRPRHVPRTIRPRFPVVSQKRLLEKSVLLLVRILYVFSCPRQASTGSSRRWGRWKFRARSSGRVDTARSRASVVHTSYVSIIATRSPMPASATVPRSVSTAGREATQEGENAGRAMSEPVLHLRPLLDTSTACLLKLTVQLTVQRATKLSRTCLSHLPSSSSSALKLCTTLLTPTHSVFKTVSTPASRISLMLLWSLHHFGHHLRKLHAELAIRVHAQHLARHRLRVRSPRTCPRCSPTPACFHLVPRGCRS